MKKRIIVPPFLKCHFGDILSVISEIELLHNNGYDVWIGDLNVHQINLQYLQYFSLYKLNWNYQITGQFDSNYEHRDYYFLYRNPILSSVISHNPNRFFKKISFSKDVNWTKKNKINPEWDLLWNSIKNIEWIEVNKNVGNTLLCEKMIAESDLYIGVDNGVSHLAKSIGTPMILLEHEFELEHAFPSSLVKYKKAKTKNETLSLIKNHYLNKFGYEII